MVYVFKTSVNDTADVDQLKPLLETTFGESSWSFDLDDCDKILRVESEKDRSSEIIEILKDFSFDCEELPD